MEEPKEFSQLDDQVLPFVIAMKVDSLLPACRILLIHGRDLTWGTSGFGQYIVSFRTRGDLDDAVQQIAARAGMSLSGLIRTAIQRWWSDVRSLLWVPEKMAVVFRKFWRVSSLTESSPRCPGVWF